jgi:hypothetical protein
MGNSQATVSTKRKTKVIISHTDGDKTRKIQYEDDNENDYIGNGGEVKDMVNQADRQYVEAMRVGIDDKFAIN